MKELGLITQIRGVSMLKAGVIQLTFSQGGRRLKLEYCSWIQMDNQNVFAMAGFLITLIIVSSGLTESELIAGWRSRYEGYGVTHREKNVFGILRRSWRNVGGLGRQVAGAEQHCRTQTACERHTDKILTQHPSTEQHRQTVKQHRLQPQQTILHCLRIFSINLHLKIHCVATIPEYLSVDLLVFLPCALGLLRMWYAFS